MEVLLTLFHKIVKKFQTIAKEESPKDVAVSWQRKEKRQRNTNGSGRIKKMGGREVGRHWRTKKGRKVPTLREIKRVKAEISEVRTPSESEVYEQIAKSLRRQKKTRSRKYRAKANQRQNICKKQIKKVKQNYAENTRQTAA